MKFVSKLDDEKSYHQDGIVMTITPGQELELSNDVGVRLLENEALVADVEAGLLNVER